MSYGILLNHGYLSKELWIYNNGLWVSGVSSFSKTSGSGAYAGYDSYFRLTDYSGMNGHAIFGSNVSIDVTKYSTLLVRYKRSSTSNYSGKTFRFGLSSSKSSLQTASGWISSTSKTLAQIDISGVTGNKYLVFEDYNWNTTVYVYIYEIYLLK